MFAKSAGNQPVMQKKIPTVLGLLILLAALISGLIFFGDGTGVFTPRATADVTPNNIVISNLKPDGFTVSFFTDKATTGFIKYGTEPTRLNSQASDDRDQLSGSLGEYRLHHITVRGLDPGTNYYYVLGTESRNEFDNEGQPFQITTPTTPTGSMPPAITIYGSISNEGGTPAEGAVVHVGSEQMFTLSSLVKGSGSWAIPLSQALLRDGSDYANLEPTDIIHIRVTGENPEDVIEYSVEVEAAQPARELSFGQTYDVSAEEEEASTNEMLVDAVTPEYEMEDDVATVSADLDDLDVEDESDDVIGDQMQQMLEEADPLPTESTASSELVLRGETSAEPVVTTSKPTIRGQVAPNTEVKISIHSETQYETTLTTSSDGSFELDLDSLGLDLEPGEHTITYSYLDSDTGEEVVVTENFWVEDSEQILLAQADTSPSGTTTTTTTTNNVNEDEASTSEPYGTGSPYPMATPTPIIELEPDIDTTVETATKAETATEATTPARQQQVGTEGALIEAGSIGATLLVAISGAFLVIIGSWSWWLAFELETEN